MAIALFPYAAPSIGAFIGNSPLGGVARKPHFARRTGMSFLANPDKCEKRRKQAASGGFLLDTFLCPYKDKVSRLPVRELALK
jgi:hypothetical protein